MLVELLQILELLHDHLQILGVPSRCRAGDAVAPAAWGQLVVSAALLHQLLEDVLECGSGIVGRRGGGRVGHTTWTGHGAGDCYRFSGW